MIGRLLCWLKFHKHPKTYSPSYWQCARPGCEEWTRQKWY